MMSKAKSHERHCGFQNNLTLENFSSRSITLPTADALYFVLLILDLFAIRFSHCSSTVPTSDPATAQKSTSSAPGSEPLGEIGRGAKRRVMNGSIGSKNLTCSDFRTRRAPSPTDAIVFIHHPDPFCYSLRSSQVLSHRSIQPRERILRLCLLHLCLLPLSLP